MLMKSMSALSLKYKKNILIHRKRLLIVFLAILFLYKWCRGGFNDFAFEKLIRVLAVRRQEKKRPMKAGVNAGARLSLFLDDPCEWEGGISLKRVPVTYSFLFMNNHFQDQLSL